MLFQRLLNSIEVLLSLGAANGVIIKKRLRSLFFVFILAPALKNE